LSEISRIQISVRFLGQSGGAPLLGLHEGVEGFFELNMEQNAVDFLLENATEAGPLFTIHSQDILETTPSREGMIGKKEILHLVVMDGDGEPRNLRFQIMEMSAGQAAAIFEAFRRRPEEERREKVTAAALWSKVTDSIAREAQRLAEQIRAKMDASKQLISEVGRVVARLDELGPSDFEQRVSSILDLAVETEVVPAIIKTLMAKGLVLASHDNLDEATETIRQAIAAARVENMSEEVENAQKQLAMIEEIRKSRDKGKDLSSGEENVFREQTLAAALQYMQDAQQVVHEWSRKEERTADDERGAAS